MPKINILYIVTKMELGGAQKQVLSLIRRLDEADFQVFLFTAQEGLLLDEARGIPGLKLKLSRFLERPISPVNDLICLIEIYRFIRENRIQIVHTHSSKAGILGRLGGHLAGVKNIIHTVHGWSFNDFQHPLVRGLYILLERICGSLTDCLVVVCEYDRKKGLAQRIAYSEKYKLIRYGLNYEEFSNKTLSCRSEFGLADDEFAVGMVACLKPQKAPLDFVSLAGLIHKEIPKTRFILAGDGCLRHAVEERIRRLSLQREFILLGWRRDIQRLLASLDVFVLTSLWEGQPICVLEAMLAGVAVVVTDTGGVNEVVKDSYTGFMVTPHDLQSLAEKTVTLLKNDKLRVCLAKNARDYLGIRFNLEHMVEEHSWLYQRSVNN